jgi:hypothetical protein
MRDRKMAATTQVKPLNVLPVQRIINLVVARTGTPLSKSDFIPCFHLKHSSTTVRATIL